LVFIRYSFVGVAATAVHYLIFIFCIAGLSFYPALASAIGAVSGALMAYFGNSYFTFTKVSARHRVALPKFFLVAGIGAILNASIVGIGTELIGNHYMISQLIATIIIFFLNFQINKSWTFQ